MPSGSPEHRSSPPERAGADVGLPEAVQRHVADALPGPTSRRGAGRAGPGERAVGPVRPWLAAGAAGLALVAGCSAGTSAEQACVEHSVEEGVERAVAQAACEAAVDEDE